MNPGSMFGSGFGQPQLSPFGTVARSASDAPAPFGVNPGFTSSGSTSQVFGPVNTASTSFGTLSGSTGFGATSGTDSRSTIFGNPGPGSGSGNVFGSPGLTASDFGAGTPAQAFGTSTSAPGFGTGTMSQNTGFGSEGSTSGSGFGTPGFGGGTASTESGTESAGTPFGSGFNKGTSFAALSAASSVSGTTGTEPGLAFGTGGSVFGGGTTAFGTSSSGFGTGTSAIASSGFSTTSTPGFGMGPPGFSTGSAGFGTSTPGFGPSSSSSAGVSTFGTSTASGGSSVFGSFTGAQGTSTTLSTAQTQSNPFLGGSSIFGSKAKTTGDAGQGFTPSSVAAVSCQAGSASVFGSRVSSSTPGFGPGGPATSSVFGQIPTPTASVTRSSVFGTNMGTSGTGTNALFGTPSATSSDSSTNTVVSVFGGAQAGSVFGVPQAAKEVTQMSSSAGSFSVSGLPPPSYSASISAGHPAPFSTASVFGGASRTTSGEGNAFGGAARTMASGEGSVFGAASKTSSGGGSVFGGASRTTSGEGSVFGGAAKPMSSGEGSVFGAAAKTSSGGGTVFGGASRATSGEGNTFGGASRTTSGEGSVFGGASRTALGEGSAFGGASRTRRASREGTVFGGASKTSSGEGSVFGGAGRSVIKQESLQQSNLQRPPAVSQPSQSVYGASHPFGGKFSPVFGGKPRPNEERQPLPSQPLFPAASSVLIAGSSDPKTKQESERRGDTFGTMAGGDSSGQRHGQEAEGPTSMKSRQLGSMRADTENAATSTVSVFGGKRGFPQTEAVPGGSTFAFRTDTGSIQSQKRSATRDETGKVDFKRGRTEEQEDQDRLTTGGQFQGHPSPSRTPEKMKLRRSSSVLEDVSSRTSICCKGLSANVNKGSLLRPHFSRFGTVKRVHPVPSKGYAIIRFETHEAAARAKRHGTQLPGHDKPLSIFWKSSANEKSPGTTEDTATQSRFTFRRPEAAEARPAGKGESNQRQQLPSLLPSSVAAELASMSGADSDVVTGTDKHRFQDRKSTREGRSPHRKEPAQRTTARVKTPPPSLSSTTSTLPSSTASSLGKTMNVTVSGLRKMVASTTMDKVNVLDTRDKLMRQKLGKQMGGGVHAKAFVGTCPDMCPEKERMYREEVRRLSIYEIIPGSSTLTGSTSLVDHTKAVKEYSRSSADQDEPLPHELRPLPVLTMTMNYLLVEIANCGEDGKWPEWYDFLWNRTRSIRKEITQQQLCSQEVVDLLEKCVRFHIYCSERLCTEDMMVFDSKINDENLTKCLQTLKELYADMENKHSLYCPNEAEFRAYIVLMNLNEGDTLREVQQLRHAVRASPEIGFAVKAYSALYSNNYVRFFRLLRSAAFLNACILHRYFNQIRAQALRIILRSHTAGQKKVGFPLSELQRLLVFENEEEIREFCSYYGLHARGGDLLLDRAAYVEPEISIPSWRAVGLVESKRAGSVGEVINGGPLRPVNLPRPQCSFDDQGRFIGSLEGLIDGQEAQEKVKPFAIKAEAKPPQLQPSPLQKAEVAAADGAVVLAANDVPDSSRQAVISEESADVNKQQLKPSSEVLKTIARDLFFEVIDQHARQVAESVIATQWMVHQCEVHIESDVTSSVVSDLARQVSSEVVEAEKERRDKMLAAEKREREARVMADVLVSVMASAVEDQAREIAVEEIEEAEDEERRERCTLALQSELVGEVIREEVMAVADQVHQVDVVARLQLLNDLQKAVELKRTAQWLAVWRKALKIRQRQKRAMLDFPCAPPMHSASQRLQSMYPDRPEHASPLIQGKAALMVNHRAQMTLLSPLESEQRSLTFTAHLSLASLLSSLQRMRAWQPLNLASLLRAPLNQAVQQWSRRFVNELSPLNVQWKLLLSLPGEEEEGGKDGDDDSMTGGAYTHDPLMAVLKEWLCAKFTRRDTSATTGNTADSSKRNLLSQYSIDVASSAAAPPRLRVGVCVRSVPEFARRGKGNQPTKEQSLALTKGTSAILFLLPHADTTDETTWLAARLRLAKLLEAKPFLPATPLALLLPCGLGTAPGSMTDEVTRRLALQDFQDQDLVSDVAVVELAVRDGQPSEVAVAASVLQTQVSEAVRFLASKVPEPPDLRRERVGDVVEDMVNQHFFTPVLQDLKGRLHLNKLHQAPNTLIGLYNSLLDHICLALTSPSLEDFSWPAPELQLSAATREDWNSNTHLGDIYELVSSLRLPWFHYQDAASGEWGQVCHDVWTFVNAVVKKRCDSAVSLTSRISRVLAHTCLQFENACSLTQNEDHCTPTYINAPWTDIIVACVEFRLQRLHNWKDEEEDVGGDLEVFFEGEDLEEFEPPASWIQALLDTEDAESQRMENTIEQASILHYASQPAAVEQDTFTTTTYGKDDDDIDRRSDNTLPAGKNEPPAPPPHNSDLPENIRSALETSEKLLLHVEEERQKAQAFERYLQKALQGDTSPPDLNLSTIFLSPRTTPMVVSTPVLSSSATITTTTPFRPLSAIRQSGASSSWTPEDPSLRRASLAPQYNLEPRRLMGEKSEMFAAAEMEGDDSEAERGREGSLSLYEGVEQFKENLQAQRYANELFEKRLQSLLES